MHKAQIKTKSTKHKDQNVCVFRSLGSVFFLCFVFCVLNPMLNPNVKLIPDLSKPELVATRDGYGKGVVEAGEKDERVVVLCADLTESTRSHWFAEKFPERFVEIGVAEQNLALVASGLANYGKIPFISSYAAFSPGRNNEQIRTNICINNV